jgi:hypothetical protein
MRSAIFPVTFRGLTTAARLLAFVPSVCSQLDLSFLAQIAVRSTRIPSRRRRCGFSRRTRALHRIRASWAKDLSLLSVLRRRRRLIRTRTRVRGAAKRAAHFHIRSNWKTMMRKLLSYFTVAFICLAAIGAFTHQAAAVSDNDLKCSPTIERQQAGLSVCKSSCSVEKDQTGCKASCDRTLTVCTKRISDRTSACRREASTCENDCKAHHRDETCKKTCEPKFEKCVQNNT